MGDDLAAVPPVTAADYIAAVAQHVASVCVITTIAGRRALRADGDGRRLRERRPPRLLVCVNRTGQTHEKIMRAGRFCVNVLTEAQDNIAMAFAGMAGPRTDRFTVGEWTTLVTGAPVLQTRRRHSTAGCREFRAIHAFRAFWRGSRDPSSRRGGHAALRRAALSPTAQDFLRFRERRGRVSVGSIAVGPQNSAAGTASLCVRAERPTGRAARSAL